MTNKEYGFATRSVHDGVEADPTTGARQLPIFQTASYQFNDSDEAANKFNLEDAGFVYSRVNNPTVDALEKRIASLENGSGGTAAASGLGAQFLLFNSFMEPGDDFIFSKRLYGGSFNQMKNAFKRFGWNGIIVDPDDPNNFKEAMTDKVKAIFVESISNPHGTVADLEGIAAIAKDAGVLFIVDNTIPTPYLCKPIEWGADVVTHSTTKFLSGNGTAMGGVVVESGTFDWTNNPKYPAIGKAEPTYSNRNLHEEFGDKALTVHMHGVGLRDTGVCMSPMNAFLTILSIETLPLRMEKHCSNALKLAEFLVTHPNVDGVTYAGLKDSPYYDLAQKYTPKGASAVYTFNVKGGYDAGRATVENAELFSHIANIGDTRSLIIHPASTTHRQMTKEDLLDAGITPSTVRISPGIEDIDDLIADIDQAISSAHKQKAA